MKKRFFIPACVLAAAAVCFGIVSYGHFYRGRMELGWVFALLTIAQLIIALKNDSILKKNK